MAKVAEPGQGHHARSSTTRRATRRSPIAIQSNWQKLGINVTLKQQDWPQFLQFLGPPPNKAVDAYRNGWIADFPDDINFLSLFECGSGNNNTNWCNKKYDDAAEAGDRRADTSRSATTSTSRLEAMLDGPNGDMPIAPIYWYTFAYQVEAERPRDGTINPMDSDRPHQGEHQLIRWVSRWAGARPPASPSSPEGAEC